jgi:hypothetical protein
MIIVKVELWSAIDGSKQELARMVIDNIGGTHTMGNYRTRSLIGRSREALDRALHNIPMKVQRESQVIGHARLKLHVWHLVSKALLNMGYGK